MKNLKHLSRMGSNSGDRGKRKYVMTAESLILVEFLLEKGIVQKAESDIFGH